MMPRRSGFLTIRPKCRSYVSQISPWRTKDENGGMLIAEKCLLTQPLKNFVSGSAVWKRRSAVSRTPFQLPMQWIAGCPTAVCLQGAFMR